MAGTAIRLKTLPYKQTEKFDVDREKLLIRNATAMVAGVEALGHGAESDQQTIQMAADIMNMSRRPIRTRLGHPGASENATGRKLAIAKNFRVEGDKLKHDLQFMRAARKSPAFSRDPVEWVFDMAVDNPEEIAESVVMMAERVWKLSDGREINIADEEEMAKLDKGKDRRPLKATTRLPVFRPTSLTHVDIVDEGALTHGGLFSAEDQFMIESLWDGTGSAAAEEFFDLLDYWRDELGLPLSEIPDKAEKIAQRYLAARGYTGETEMAKETNGKIVGNRTKANIAAVGTGGASSGSVASLLPETVDEAPDTLGEALALAEETEQSLTAEPEADPVELVALRNEVVELRDMVGSLSEQLELVQRLAEMNSRNNAALDRRQRIMDDEPMVTRNVPRTPRAPLGQLEYDAPAPPANVAATVRLAANRPQPTATRTSPMQTPVESAPQVTDPAQISMQHMAQRRQAGVKL